MKIPKFLAGLANLLAGLFITAAAVLIVLYSQGYRFDKDDNKLEKTGVITINGAPLFSDLYLEGKKEGKIPHSISSLSEGTYEVMVSRKGYQDWKKKVAVYPEKSSIVYAYLLKSQPEKETVFKIDDSLEDIVLRDAPGEIYLITSKAIDQTAVQDLTDIKAGKVGTDVSDTDINQEKTYKVWKYKTDPYFWEISSNPQLIFSSDQSHPNSEMTFKVSQNGKYLLVSIKSDTSSSLEIWQTNGDLQQTPIEISSALLDSTPIWSKTDNSILFISETEILSFNINNQSTTVLFKGDTNKAVWNTDENGVLYLLSTQPDNKTNIEQIDLETGKRLDTNLIEEIPLKTPEEDKSADSLKADSSADSIPVSIDGDISSIVVSKEYEYVLILTSQKSYFYDLSQNEYSLISAEPLSFLDTTDEVVLLKNENDLKLFRFSKDEADPITRLGTQTITFSQKLLTSFSWHKSQNSGYILYISDGFLESIDSDGENSYKIIPIRNEFYAQDKDGKNIYTIDKDNAAKSLVRYKIH